ncbi:hypothetical protein CLOSTHATH_01167 [Hungatella hathewayi DSM 13479]|uniref:Uncharacterized protein n=1 Tax=Hungatella hathewayi DSM 13479 TaxID=566550 RepID=D3AC39_9FIRM|nr:hypothetical protein CLOSTHATH_01167 [Hungatella hathewayi DSM 13479]
MRRITHNGENRIIQNQACLFSKGGIFQPEAAERFLAGLCIGDRIEVILYLFV